MQVLSISHQPPLMGYKFDQGPRWTVILSFIACIAVLLYFFLHLYLEKDLLRTTPFMIIFLPQFILYFISDTHIGIDPQSMELYRVSYHPWRKKVVSLGQLSHVVISPEKGKKGIKVQREKGVLFFRLDPEERNELFAFLQENSFYE